ncbi:MAG: universal stress protein [Myxococcota bacterium]|nr:universal stress protein [Myxococcota bacterium]
MISTILLASDGSEVASAAERFATALAQRSRARLLGLSVVEERLARGFREDGLGVAPPASEPLAAYLKSRADAVGRRVVEHARSQGVESHFESVQGIADDLIVERGQQADLLVLGRDGQGKGYRTGLIGSTVNGVIRKTAKSALVVPAGAQLSGPIMLGFDGSPGSRIAAGVALDLAQKLSEQVHVFVDSKDKGRANARVSEVRELLNALPAPLREVQSTLGRPDVKLVDAAREVRAGMIVMGAFARNRITEYFLGSNSAAVVRTSPIAVLLAR